MVPGLQRHPLKKLQADPVALLLLLQRWRDEATKAGHTINRIAVAFEAGRDGFWLARWLRKNGIEAHVIHPTSVSVSREHRLVRAHEQRWIGGMTSFAPDNPLIQHWLKEVSQQLESRGWKAGANLRIDYYGGYGGNLDQARVFAKELVSWRPT